MKITIEGTEKEIASLVLELQERHGEESADDIIRQVIESLDQASPGALR